MNGDQKKKRREKTNWKMMENSGLIDLRACIKLKVSNSICFPRLHHMHLIEWGAQPNEKKKREMNFWNQLTVLSMYAKSGWQVSKHRDTCNCSLAMHTWIHLHKPRARRISRAAYVQAWKYQGIKREGELTRPMNISYGPFMVFTIVIWSTQIPNRLSIRICVISVAFVTPI